jgi:hypothetical protein
MNKWFVVHSLESFAQNPRMIGFAGKTRLDGSPVLDGKGNITPAFGRILDLKPMDRIVYYCKGDSVIKGIYEIVQPHYAKEPQWPDSPFQFEIRPIVELVDSYDFKVLVSALDLFKGLADPRNWGVRIQGMFNSIVPLTEHDYQLIEKSLTLAHKQATVEEKEGTKEESQDYGQHLRIQHQITEWGLKNNYRVHVATNDKGKIRERLSEILEEMPKFAAEDVANIAKRVDVLFFREERDILTHAFEIEHTPTIYSGLLRLNDIAESYPSENVKFFIISDEENRERFNRELDRPSFRLLKKHKCAFRNYQEVNEEYKQLQHRRSPIF